MHAGVWRPRRGRLGCRAANLRKLVRTHPVVADAIFEQIEQEIDAAQQVLWDGLKSDNAMTRIRAVAYVLRHTEAGADAAGGRAASHDEPVEPQTATLKWLDT
jgi:hypothetical protein